MAEKKRLMKRLKQYIVTKTIKQRRRFFKKINCFIFGHRINRSLVEYTREKKCISCGKQVYDLSVYTAEDYFKDIKS